MNPLTTVKWPLIIGFVVAVAIAALVSGGLTFNAATLASLTRWLHIVFGVFWIGLLYYFNAVQTPAMAVATVDGGDFCWHARGSGIDTGAMVAADLLPLLAGKGLAADRIAWMGWSMGG